MNYAVCLVFEQMSLLYRYKKFTPIQSGPTIIFAYVSNVHYYSLCICLVRKGKKKLERR